jgi:hypothetical protein
MKSIVFILLILAFSLKLNGQAATENLKGNVSFITSQNVYVQFKSTSGISPGDTLYIFADGKYVPALKVTSLSSTSCLCILVSNLKILDSQPVIARVKRDLKQAVVKTPGNEQNMKPLPKTEYDTTRKQIITNGLKERISGSMAIYSYDNFSNTPAKGSTQMRYTLTLDARNISDSKFSVNTYLSFRHKVGAWNEVKANIFNALKIYGLSVTYDPDRTSHLSAGRKINYNISSIGAIDGIQYEKTFNSVSVGAIAGFRPDYANYGFDGKLFQYGAYVALNSKTLQPFHQTSFAIMEQMNKSKTDRRFLYFQHTNMLIKNVYFFGTLEADLYKVKNNSPQTTFDITGLYLSLRYNMTSNLSLTASYDARKNITYYETYKSLIDSVINNRTRQSVRLQVSYRINNNIMVGIQSDYRYLKTDPAPSRNVNGYVSCFSIPGLNISATISGSYLETGFLKGKVIDSKLTRDIFMGRMQVEAGYQYVDYKLTESKTDIRQHMAEAGIYCQLEHKVSFSVNWEGTFEKKSLYNRLYLQLRKRF